MTNDIKDAPEPPHVPVQVRVQVPATKDGRCVGSDVVDVVGDFALTQFGLPIQEVVPELGALAAEIQALGSENPGFARADVVVVLGGESPGRRGLDEEIPSGSPRGPLFHLAGLWIRRSQQRCGSPRNLRRLAALVTGYVEAGPIDGLQDLTVIVNAVTAFFLTHVTGELIEVTMNHGAVAAARRAPNLGPESKEILRCLIELEDVAASCGWTRRTEIDALLAEVPALASPDEDEQPWPVVPGRSRRRTRAANVLEPDAREARVARYREVLATPESSVEVTLDSLRDLALDFRAALAGHFVGDVEVAVSRGENCVKVFATRDAAMVMLWCLAIDRPGEVTCETSWPSGGTLPGGKRWWDGRRSRCADLRAVDMWFHAELAALVVRDLELGLRAPGA